MKKFISLLLAILMFCPCVFCAAHAEDIAPYSSNYFVSYGTTLSKEGNGKIKIVFSATGTNICTRIGVATYQVERLEDDGDWVDVSGLLSGSTGTGVNTYTFSRFFHGVAGETYRVKVTFTCTLNGDSETQSYTSGGIKAN